MLVQKIYCDMCKEKEITGASDGSLTFTFNAGSPLKGNWVSIVDKHLLLCDECTEKVVNKILELELFDKE